MPSYHLVLVEYRMDAVSGKYQKHDCTNPTIYPQTPEGKSSLVFKDNPKSARKGVKLYWRVRHTGRAKLMKAKYKPREEINFTISGSCDKDQRAMIEFFAKQEAKFRVRIAQYTGNTFNSWKTFALDPVTKEVTPSYLTIFFTPQQGAICYTSTVDDLVFVVIDDISFTSTEGKIGWYDYQITLKRVNCQDIQGTWTDELACTGTPS